MPLPLANQAEMDALYNNPTIPPGLLRKAVFWIDAAHSTPGEQVAQNYGSGGSVLDATYGSGATVDAADPILLTHTGENYLYVPGIVGNNASSPNSAALNVPGDLDVSFKLASMVPLGTAQGFLFGKWGGGAQRSWYIQIQSNGTLSVQLSPDGTNIFSKTFSSTALLSTINPTWVRFTIDVDNGAAGTTCIFYTSSDGVTWVQLGTPVIVAGAMPTIFAGTDPLLIGSVGATNPNFPGKFYRLIIKSGIGGTTVFDADFTTGITSGASTTFVESSVNAATVTINRAASGLKSVAVVRPVWLFGAWKYLQIPDNPLMDFGALQDFTAVAIARVPSQPAGGTRSIFTKGTYGSNDPVWAIASTVGGNGKSFIGSVTAAGMYWYSNDITGGVNGLKVFLVRSGAAMKFIDSAGTDVGVITPFGSGGVFSVDISSTSAVQVGATALDFDGEITAVALFRRVLTVAEMASIVSYYA